MATMPAEHPIEETAGASVECHRVEKWFGELNVLADVEFSIEPGAFVSVLGPSGCGKTTLMRAIGGLVPIDEGEILINGGRVSGPPKEAAIVFQQFGLMPWKTIYDNVAFGLRVAGLGKKETEARVRHFLDLVHLTGFEGSFPYQVSGGMQQRAGLARALAVEPQLLLMDEPFASVDAMTREVLHDELLGIWERDRRTVVFITHSIDEAIVLSDEIFVMSRSPATVVARIPVEIPRPRRERTVRGLPQFTELRERCWDLLEHGGAEEAARS
ncbi:MAG TPA: ABC transporter ATP-binding protein [Gaiellaceae bacterium]|nr:ABC transporter ATP-binding protein [Gaiellaceae bacterium]